MGLEGYTVLRVGPEKCPVLRVEPGMDEERYVEGEEEGEEEEEEEGQEEELYRLSKFLSEAPFLLDILRNRDKQN